MKRIMRNAIRCNLCGDVIESKHTHDFKWCKCRSVFVDGGQDYLRRGAVNSLDDFVELSKYEESLDELMDQIIEENIEALDELADT